MRFLNLLILLFAVMLVNAQKLSSKAELSIITCAPGDELYSAFGHNALRVSDPERRIDKVYNYGTFDFNTPNFYLKFTQGELDYMLSVAPFKRFVRSYAEEERLVREQVLNLDSLQKQAIYDFLENNAKPENKFYRYDFLYDNCATRVKDVVKATLGDKLKLGESGLTEGTTFRDMLHLYLKDSKWIGFGIDALLSLPADKVVTNEDATFLPDYLYNVMQSGTIQTETGTQKIVKEENVLFQPIETESPDSSGISPLIFFSVLLIFVLSLSFLEYKLKKNFAHFDYALFFIIGLIGLLLTFMWFGTEHVSMVNNFNIIWAMPLHLIAVFFYVRKKLKKLILNYFLIYGIICLLTALLYFVLPQQLNIAVIPISIMLAVRAGMIYRREKSLN